ncbi:MAG: hypothetical protein E6I52_07145 [Chloroflexi bacterium]|nr:MAG: hypothetical protein E6I52_07145 [Chloroflexota bacterium]
MGPALGGVLERALELDQPSARRLRSAVRDAPPPTSVASPAADESVWADSIRASNHLRASMTWLVSLRHPITHEYVPGRMVGPPEYMAWLVHY